MGKLAKASIAIFGFAIITVIFLSLFVKMYLTDDRVRALVIPPAEEALGRKVNIGAISVSIFSGITIRDFTVKEADGEKDFVGAQSFVLRYNLLPLLHKKLIISEARLESPSINISRDNQGIFNYETLAVMKKEANQADSSRSGPPAAALPVALTVSQVKVDGATISFKDGQGALPSADVTASFDVSLDLGSDLSSLRYQGKLEATVSTTYGEMKPRIALTSSFDEKKADYTADVKLGEEDFRLQGRVENYRQTPAVALDLTSRKLNLDRLLAMTAAGPTKSDKKPTATPKKAPADGLPPGFTATGTIKIDETLYKKLAIKNFSSSYQLKGGTLTISDLNANTAGGKIESSATIDLNRPELAYSGNVSVQSLQLSELAAGLALKEADSISGLLETTLTFNGAGTEWNTIRNVLTADGTYSITDARFRNTPLARTISSVIGLPELNDMTFRDVRGEAHLLKGGRLNITSSFTGKAVSATSTGTVSLDGTLDMPLTVTLAPQLAEKLDRRATVSRFLADSEGNTVIPLKLAGTLSSPRPTVDTSGAQKQVTETVKRKAMEEIGKALSGSKGSSEEAATGDSPATNFLKGILGR